MASLIEVGLIAIIVGMFQACSNAFFTWFANRTLIKKLNQLDKKLTKDKNGNRR